MNLYKNLLFLHGYLLVDDEAPVAVPARPAADGPDAVRPAAAAMPGTARPLPPCRPSPAARAIGCAG